MTAELCDPQEWAERPLIYDLAAVQARLPQRHEMLMLHGVLHVDAERTFAIGVHESKPTDFWVKGHIPGRPLMPGVVMIEIAAQLATFLASLGPDLPPGGFMGFGGVDEARFRGTVVPGDRLLVAARLLRQRRQLKAFTTQAWVGPELVFEAQLMGVLV